MAVRSVGKVVRQGNFVSVQKQIREIEESIKQTITDPKKRRSIYIAVMKKAALPVKTKMRSHVPAGQTRLRNSIKARGVNVTHLRQRDRLIGGGFQDPYQPVIHVGPQRKSSNKDYAFYWHWTAYGTKNRLAKKDPKWFKNEADGEMWIVPSRKRGQVQANNYADKTFKTSQQDLENIRDKVFNSMMATMDKQLQKRGLKR